MPLPVNLQVEKGLSSREGSWIMTGFLLNNENNLFVTLLGFLKLLLQESPKASQPNQSKAQQHLKSPSTLHPNYSQQLNLTPYYQHPSLNHLPNQRQICTYIYMYIYICIYICISMHVYTFRCIHIGTYACVYNHMYIYIYVYRTPESCVSVATLAHSSVRPSHG